MILHPTLFWMNKNQSAWVAGGENDAYHYNTRTKVMTDLDLEMKISSIKEMGYD